MSVVDMTKSEIEAERKEYPGYEPVDAELLGEYLIWRALQARSEKGELPELVMNVLLDRLQEVECRLLAMPARSLMGIAAKHRLCYEHYAKEGDDTPPELVRSIAADIAAAVDLSVLDGRAEPERATQAAT